MKLYILLCVVALAVAAEDKYSTQKDDFDIEAVINNDEQLKGFYGCFVDTSDCNELTAHFKKDLPEAIQQACGKCTPAQKHILRRFLEGLRQKFPDGYEEFKKKFDPETKYFSNLETAISSA